MSYFYIVHKIFMSRLFMPLVCKNKTSSTIGGVFFLLQYYLSQCIITFCVRLNFLFFLMHISLAVLLQWPIHKLLCIGKTHQVEAVIKSFFALYRLLN